MNMLVSTAATATAAAAVAAPAINSEIPDGREDPIFAAIAEYRAAVQAESAAVSDHCQRENRLHVLGLLCPSIALRDMRHTEAGQPCIAYSHEQIDVFVPADRFPEQNARHHAMFEPLRSQRDQIIGDSERILSEAQDATSEALENVSTVLPTTLEGVLALLALPAEWYERDYARSVGPEILASLCITVQDVLRDLTRSPSVAA